jgi:hypothetical protein
MGVGDLGIHRVWSATYFYKGKKFFRNSVFTIIFLRDEW